MLKIRLLLAFFFCEGKLYFTSKVQWDIVSKKSLLVLVRAAHFVVLDEETCC